MKIRRKSEKGGQGASPDGVPPLHTLITCTYQKLFKKDGVAGFDNGAAWDRPAGHGTGHAAGRQHKRQKLQRHELGSSWADGGRLLEVIMVWLSFLIYWNCGSWLWIFEGVL